MVTYPVRVHNTIVILKYNLLVRIPSITGYLMYCIMNLWQVALYAYHPCSSLEKLTLVLTRHGNLSAGIMLC